MRDRWPPGLVFDPIASRTLEVDGQPVFHVRLGKPRLDNRPGDPGDTWTCEYEVETPSGPHRFYACAEDSLQAMLYALYQIEMSIDISDEHKAGRLTWRGQGEDFGVPMLGACPGIRELHAEYNRRYPDYYPPTDLDDGDG